MSTPCIVSCHTEEGYLSIYVHNEGHPTYMFPLLRDWYATEERAKSLVKFGDAFCIAKRLLPSIDSEHSFCQPEQDVCIFYHRDGGSPKSQTDPKLLMVNPGESSGWPYYVYLFENDQWHLFTNGKEVDSHEY